MVEVVEKIEVREERPVELDELSVAPTESEIDLVPEIDEMGKVLLKARDYIHAYGWCQNEYMDYSEMDSMPSVCMLGAVNHAMGRALDDPDGWYGWRKNIIGRLGFAFGDEAVNWNDTTDRTQQEVEERLERAAYNL